MAKTDLSPDNQVESPVLLASCRGLLHPTTLESDEVLTASEGETSLPSVPIQRRTENLTGALRSPKRGHQYTEHIGELGERLVDPARLPESHFQ